MQKHSGDPQYLLDLISGHASSTYFIKQQLGLVLVSIVREIVGKFDLNIHQRRIRKQPLYIYLFKITCTVEDKNPRKRIIKSANQLCRILEPEKIYSSSSPSFNIFIFHHLIIKMYIISSAIFRAIRTQAHCTVYAVYV